MKVRAPGARAARLEEVSQRAGVSISTVSRALSGNPSISSSTRDAVQAAAAEIGYRLPTHGRKNRKAATKIVGVVIGALHNRFMTVLLEHLHDALHQAGYHVTLIIDSMNDARSLQTLRPLIDGFLDGMIFATATLDSPVVAELQRRGIPLVLVVRSVDGMPVDTVEIDNIYAASEAARHLYEFGHRRIGLVMGQRDTSTSRDRAEGAMRWLETNGIARENIPLVFGDFTTESGYSSTVSLLTRPDPVTAIIAGNDTIALGVLDAAYRHGFAVPESLSVIGFDDIPMAGSPLLALTTIRQPVEAMARTAAKRLVERMQNITFSPPKHDVLPIHLVQRDTTGPART